MSRFAFHRVESPCSTLAEETKQPTKEFRSLIAESTADPRVPKALRTLECEGHMLSQPVAKKPKHNKKLIKKGEKALEVAFNALQYAGTLTVAFAFSSVGLENIVAYLPEILPLGVAIGLIKSYFDERRKKREAMGKGITEPITPAFSENKFLEHSVNFAATAAGLSILINLLDGFSLQLPWLAIVSGCAGIAYGGIRTLTEGHYKEHFKSTRENSDDWNNDSEY